MTSKVLTCETEIKHHCHKGGWKVKKDSGRVYVASIAIGDDDHSGEDEDGVDNWLGYSTLFPCVEAFLVA